MEMAVPEVDQGMRGERASPEVSVVIPAYCAAAHIGEALASVFAQSFTDYEVIVVNDGSPDTPELEAALQPYVARLIYLKQPNRGPGGARNHGILATRGEFVALLDSDDAWDPAFLAEQLRLLRAGSGLDLVYADAEKFGDAGDSGRTLMDSAPSRGDVTFEALVRLDCNVFTSCVVARRRALVEAGLFDERFFHSEDWDLWLRLAYRGARIGYQRRVLGRHRVHAASLTAQRGGLQRGQIRICDKLLGSLDLSPAQRHLLEAFRERSRAHLRLDAGKRSFLRGEYADAVRCVADANRTLRSWKLHVAVLGLRVAPSLLRSMYVRRHPRLASTLSEGAA